MKTSKRYSQKPKK